MRVARFAQMISFSLFVQPEQYDRYRMSLYSHVVPTQAGPSTPSCAPSSHDASAPAPSFAVAGGAKGGPPPGAAADTATFVDWREIAAPSISVDDGSGEAGGSGDACGGCCGTDCALPEVRVQRGLHPVPSARGEVGRVLQTGFYPLSDVSDPMID